MIEANGTRRPQPERYYLSGKLPEDLLDLNPYHSVPTLVDRDLVLYDSRVIIEYLDERFPHPPLMPVDPVTRAQFRLALYRIERDWYALVQQIEQDPDKKNTVKLKKILRDTVLQSTELFKVKPYFLSDEFSLVDATIAPVLPQGVTLVTTLGERRIDRDAAHLLLLRFGYDRVWIHSHRRTLCVSARRAAPAGRPR